MSPTPTLNFDTVRLIWENDFSALVSQVYGRPYRFQQQGDMMHQESIHRFTVPTTPDGGWTLPSIEEWKNAPVEIHGPQDPKNLSLEFFRDLYWEREYYPPFDELVEDLHKLGILEPGDYALHIWW